MISRLTILKFLVHFDDNKNKLRAVNVHVAEESEIDLRIMSYARQLDRDAEGTNRNNWGHVAEREQSNFIRNPSRAGLDSFNPGYQTGKISRFFDDRGYGFIYADNFEDRVFFHRDQLMPDVVPQAGTRVIFYLSTNKEGYIARSISRLL